MKIAIAIATLGRAADLGCALRDLSRQTMLPRRVIVSASGPEDIDADAVTLCAVPVDVLYGPKGLTRQRNRVLDALRDEDVVLFLDDDFVMAHDFVAGVERIFRCCPDIAIATGDVLADGIGDAGLSHDQARAILRLSDPLHRNHEMITVNNGYGCNMAFRTAPILRHALRFDETLPLYGWLEDVDFCARLSRHGRCVKSHALRGVHRGAKAGRTSGLRLGYSQVANPLYLTGRATMRRGHALGMIGRNILANAAKSLRPEPWVDRRGRLRGNVMALVDLLAGRMSPLRVLDLGGSTDGRN